MCGVGCILPTLMDYPGNSHKGFLQALPSDCDDNLKLLGPTSVAVAAAFILPVPGLVGGMQKETSKLACADSKTTNLTASILSELNQELEEVSRSVNANWEFTQSFVQDLVNRFKNPKQRMSFITYSTHGRINMKLTSNRKKINNALVELLNVRPSGGINMQHGLEKANEQIERTRAAGAKVPSLIIVLTGEELLPESFAETQVEAAKSRQLGATLYFVGVQNYQLSQLLKIAGEKDHLFQVDSGYPGLEDIVDPLIARSCVQITSVDLSAICKRDRNEVKVIGKGFKNIQEDEVVCQFRLGKETARIEAVCVKDTSITCPGLKIDNSGQAVFIDISLNNGLSFIKTDFDVSKRSCVTSRKGTPPTLLDAVSPTAPQRDVPHAVPGDTRDIDPDTGSPSPVLFVFNPLFWTVLLLMLLSFILLMYCTCECWFQ